MTLVNSVAARDVAVHLHPYTNLQALAAQGGPLVISRGQGVYVYDENGKEYIEGLAGLWCTALGFSEPRLAEAAQRALTSLPFYHSFAGKVPEIVVDLAEQLVRRAPVPMGKVLFANSGSEANDTAMKLVWYYNNAIGRPNKKKIISRLRGYHGVTIASASLTGLPNNHRDFDLPIARVLHTDCPHFYRNGKDGESESQFAQRLADNLERLILEQGADTVAAFIAEPVMGAGGVVVPPETYFARIQEVLHRHDVLLIADEVICGFGRTGQWWGSQTYKLQPDIITMAKALTSAYVPMSAVMVSAAIAEAITKQSDKIGVFAHGFTYSGHPLAAAVASEVLRIFDERDLVTHVRRVAPRLQSGFQALAAHPLVGEARGVGLLAAVELVADKDSRASFDPIGRVGAQAAKFAETRGLVVRAIGDSLAVSPPLIITEAEIDKLLGRLGDALDDTAAWLRNGAS